MLRARTVQAALSAVVAVASIGCVASAPGGALAAGSTDTCVRAGLARPKLEEAWVRHPGDRKTQSMFIVAVWPTVPESCVGVRRVPSVRFELQSPKDHAQWIDMGSFVSPARDSREVEDELEAERQAEGKSCWEPSDAGKSYVCDVDLRVTNKGGKASAYAPVAPGWPEPDPKLERYRYDCTPGPGTTHVRALVRNVVMDPETGKVIGQSEHRVPVKVKSYPRPPHPGHPKRAALQGPC